MDEQKVENNDEQSEELESQVLGESGEMEVDEIINSTDPSTMSAADRVSEYFQIRESLKTFNQDLKDLKESHADYEKLQKMNEEVKQLRQKITGSQDIHILQDKIDGLKERMNLIKEIIKAELIEANQEEIKHEGRKLKLIQTLKEMKDEELAAA